MDAPEYLLSVSLYLYGNDLYPAFVSQKHGVSPTTSQYKGEKKIGSKTGREYAPAKCGIWELKADSDSPDLCDHISKLGSRFDSGHVPFMNIERVEEGQFDLFIAGDTDEDCDGKVEFELNDESIAAIQRLSLPVRFTVSFGRP